MTVADDFRAKAIKCRQIADTIMDVQAIDGLTALAADYDAKADVADRRSSGTAEPPTTDAEPPLAPPDP